MGLPPLVPAPTPLLSQPVFSLPAHTPATSQLSPLPSVSHGPSLSPATQAPILLTKNNSSLSHHLGRHAMCLAVSNSSASKKKNEENYKLSLKHARAHATLRHLVVACTFCRQTHGIFTFPKHNLLSLPSQWHTWVFALCVWFASGWLGWLDGWDPSPSFSLAWDRALAYLSPPPQLPISSLSLPQTRAAQARLCPGAFSYLIDLPVC